MPYVRKISPDRYALLVDAFTKAGGPHYIGIAKVLLKEHGWNPAPQTLRKAWEEGWPGVKWAGPIRVLLGASEPGAPSTSETLRDESIHAVTHQTNLTGKASPQALGQGKLAESEAITQASEPPNAAAPAAPAPAAPPPGAAVAALQTVESALIRLSEERAATMLSEMKALQTARTNVIGTEVLINRILQHLHHTSDNVLRRLAAQIEQGEVVGPGKFMETLATLTKLSKENAGRLEDLMKLQRLLVGMPQQITETRTTGALSEDERQHAARTLGHMLGALSRARDAKDAGTVAHAGEQRVIDVEPVPQPVEAVEADGQPVAIDAHELYNSAE